MTTKKPTQKLRSTDSAIDHDCTIILDTNLFATGFSTSDIRWKNLILYLERTDACIQMPQVVWNEIAYHFKKFAQVQHSKIASEIETLNRRLDFNVPARNFNGHEHKSTFKHSKRSVDELTEDYLANIKQSLKLKAKDFVPPERDWFDLVVNRAIEHKPPFAQEGDKGLKDTLIWLTILSLAKKKGFKVHPVILVTKNSKDFLDASGEQLRPELREEADRAGLHIKVFSGLDAFFEKWSSHALSVDFGRIEREIDLKRLTSELTERLLCAKKSLRKNSNLLKVKINGMSFQVRSSSGKNREIDMSVSGFATDDSIGSYVEFSAEASQHANGNLAVSDFRLLG
ncbi:PIN domain-containing protein [Burkholderia ubonensis]|uniref:PIN domain-containing protein n=1 Tax=Burkholderia ubonensis TaxID=101571 RepID=UPI0009AEEBD7|nr:PIN domain-containing protein [Burkholderia ubonensis]